MTAVRKRVLLVSWLFPPHGSVGAKRAWRLARRLPFMGWEVTVLTGRAPPERLRDPTPRDLPVGVRVVEDYDPAWLAELAKRADAALYGTARGAREESASPEAPRSPTRWERARSAFDRVRHDALPTETIALYLPHAKRAALRLLREDRYDALLTTSYPYSAHVLGAAVAAEAGIPWVADLRDPWTLNFVHEQKYGFARRVERSLEARTFDRASAVTVTTETLAQAYRALYPAHAGKVHAIRNGYEAVAEPAVRSEGGALRLVHFGHVYGGARTLRDYLDALALLRAQGRLDGRGVVLENLGRLPDEDVAHAHSVGVADLLRVGAPLPYAEGIAHVRGATALLLPAWGSARGSLFLPAKLYDYLYAGGPIVAVGESDELAAILAHTRAGVLHAPRDIAGIAKTLGALLDGAYAHAPDAGAVRDYAAERGAERFASLLDGVRGARG